MTYSAPKQVKVCDLVLLTTNQPNADCQILNALSTGQILGVLFLNVGTILGTFQYHHATISMLTVTYSLDMSPVVGLTPTIQPNSVAFILSTAFNLYHIRERSDRGERQRCKCRPDTPYKSLGMPVLIYQAQRNLHTATSRFHQHNQRLTAIHQTRSYDAHHSLSKQLNACHFRYAMLPLTTVK